MISWEIDKFSNVNLKDHYKQLHDPLSKLITLLRHECEVASIAQMVFF